MFKIINCGSFFNNKINFKLTIKYFLKKKIPSIVEFNKLFPTIQKILN